MELIIGIAVVATTGLGIGLYWRKRKKRSPRLISLAALLREPVTFDVAVLASTAGRVWNADLGDGSAEGEDGFVVCGGPLNTIVHNDRPYLVNCMPCPYVEDPQSVSETIVDTRLCRLFREHQAWFSCDALWVDESTTAKEISECYRRLATLFAQFLDENCLLIYLPDTSRAYSINDETDRALMSDDPLAALQETQSGPIITVPEGDSQMQEAEAKARETWPQFVTAFEANSGQSFSVKAPFRISGITEFIWLTVTAMEGDQVYGTLANDPGSQGPLRFGSKVCVALSDIDDWYYVDPNGELQGAFTIAAIKAASRRQQKQ